MIQKAITMTSKGTFTLPAKVRKDLGLKSAGDKLILQYHEKSQQVTLEKVPNLEEMQRINGEYIKAQNIQPITDLTEIRKQRHYERAQKFRNLN